MNAIPLHANSPNLYISPWYLGAPISKFTTVMCIGTFVLAEAFDLHPILSLDMDRLLNDAEIWRVLTCQFTFGNIGEMIFGLLLLIPLLRRFEREMSTKRFGTFIIFVTALSMSWELLLSQVFPNHVRHSGPYHLIGAVMLLFHFYTPRLYPHFFGILGFDFSEKSLTYGLAAQVIFSGGFNTALPVFCGVISGYLCSTNALPIHKWELPDFFYNTFACLGAGFVDTPILNPNIALRTRRAAQRQNNINNQFYNQIGPNNAAIFPNPVVMGTNNIPNPSPHNNNIMEPAPPAVEHFTPPPPSEEAIETLTNMGFGREAAVRVLQQCDNNVEVAANRLLNEA